MFIFLTGGAGVGKSFLVKTISEYAFRQLKFPKQNLDQPSLMLTASSGKAAAGINGLTLHSAFYLYGSRTINPKHLSDLRNKYKYLKLLVIDEISMIGNKTFEHLHDNLSLIMENDSPFGGVSIIAVGDFYQLNPVGQEPVYTLTQGTLRSLSPNIWIANFNIFELDEIVRQSEDPGFASLLNRVRTGDHTEQDCIELLKLNETDTSNWSSEPLKLYPTNKLANEENMKDIESLDSPKITIVSCDLPQEIPSTTPLNKTGNLAKTVTVCIGARFMLTVNLDTSDHLVNGSLGSIKHIVKSTQPMNTLLLIKFDSAVAGDSRKGRFPLNKTWVPIGTESRSFRLGNVNYTRKQIPGILAHAITMHKAQGSTLDYVIGNLDCDGGKNIVSSPGFIYTLITRVRNRQSLRLNGFKPCMIKIQVKAHIEIERLKTNQQLNYIHPLSEIENENVVLLFNLVSYQKHIKHLISNPIYTEKTSMLCFTETKLSIDHKVIQANHLDWVELHNPTPHGLCISYKISKITLIRYLNIVFEIEAFACIFESAQERFIVLLVYRPPTSNIKHFIDQLKKQIIRFQQFSHYIIVLGDFNHDQNSSKSP